MAPSWDRLFPTFELSRLDTVAVGVPLLAGSQTRAPPA